LFVQPNTYSTSANDVVQVIHEEKEFNFQTIESGNRSYIPKRWRFPNSHYSEGMFLPVFFFLFNVSSLLTIYFLLFSQANDCEDPFQSFSSSNGKASHFRKYISNSDHTFVRMDFCFETPAGKKKW
jgi:hypothetical protein